VRAGGPRGAYRQAVRPGEPGRLFQPLSLASGLIRTALWSRGVREAMPYLFMVTINGSSPEGTLETLDRGSYDVGGFLRPFITAGYRGPIGLQCVSIRATRATTSRARWLPGEESRPGWPRRPIPNHNRRSYDKTTQLPEGRCGGLAAPRIIPRGVLAAPGSPGPTTASQSV